MTNLIGRATCKACGGEANLLRRLGFDEPSLAMHRASGALCRGSNTLWDPATLTCGYPCPDHGDSCSVTPSKPGDPWKSKSVTRIADALHGHTHLCFGLVAKGGEPHTWTTEEIPPSCPHDGHDAGSCPHSYT